MYSLTPRPAVPHVFQIQSCMWTKATVLMGHLKKAVLQARTVFNVLWIVNLIRIVHSVVHRFRWMCIHNSYVSYVATCRCNAYIVYIWTTASVPYLLSNFVEDIYTTVMRNINIPFDFVREILRIKQSSNFLWYDTKIIANTWTREQGTKFYDRPFRFLKYGTRVQQDIFDTSVHSCPFRRIKHKPVKPTYLSRNTTFYLNVWSVENLCGRMLPNKNVETSHILNFQLITLRKYYSNITSTS